MIVSEDMKDVFQMILKKSKNLMYARNQFEITRNQGNHEKSSEITRNQGNHKKSPEITRNHRKSRKSLEITRNHGNH